MLRLKLEIANREALALRDWSALPASQRKFEQVPEVKLENAILQTLRDGVSVGPTLPSRNKPPSVSISGE